jgi:hypothetical protein
MESTERRTPAVNRRQERSDERGYFHSDLENNAVEAASPGTTINRIRVDVEP